MSTTIEWLGHDSFRLSNGSTVYIDPWKIAGGPPADLILITHEHGDHCSPDDVLKILDSQTVILASATSIPKLQEAGVEADLRAIEPGGDLKVAGVRVEAVPAYNVSKFRSPGVPFHPRESNHNGYVVTMGGERIYHVGDSDLIPEMADVTCDILLVPVSGTYVMTAEEAVEASRVIDPQKYVIPMHYGEIVGADQDALYLKETLGADRVRILPKTA